MNRLRQEENNFFIDYGKYFKSENILKDNIIDEVFNFAYAMTFGDGEHRENRSGGTKKRKKGEIFINTFQGKLSELAVYDTFLNGNQEVYEKLSEPDFNVYGLGEWDGGDIMLDDKIFSVKSTKFYGNLLLLETKDWNKKGEYVPNLNKNKNSLYDYFILVRIKPDGEKIMRDHSLLYSNDISRDILYSIIKAENWEYDIPGYITQEDLIFLITNSFILPKGAMLNEKISMDAENYYIQSRDMRNFHKFVINLWLN